MLTQKQLKKLLDYNPTTGIFKWKIKKAICIESGFVAGCRDCNGYIKIHINKKSHYAHRLAFLFMEGYIPENEVDHINCNPTDNRWKNLREVSHSCNTRNCGKNKNNKSGIRGVYYDKIEKKWRAYIQFNGKQKRLGNYNYFDNAVCARFAGEQCLDWNSCNSKSSASKYVKKLLNI